MYPAGGEWQRGLDERMFSVYADARDYVLSDGGVTALPASSNTRWPLNASQPPDAPSPSRRDHLLDYEAMA